MRNSDIGKESLGQITKLIKENCTKAKISCRYIEEMTITCSAEDSKDTMIELEARGFIVRKRHPIIKGTMRLDLTTVVLVAERDVSRPKKG